MYIADQRSHFLPRAKPIGSDQRFILRAFFPEDVHVEPLETSLLFHELVHAVQYQHPGLDRFRDRYVGSLLTRGSYEEIALEKQAYELEDKFVRDPSNKFSVEADFIERIRRKQF